MLGRIPPPGGAWLRRGLATAVALTALGLLRGLGPDPAERARWEERAQRLPLPVLTAPSRGTAVRAGGKGLELAEPTRGRVLERLQLPTASPVIAVAECSTPALCAGRLVAVTFDEGAYLVERGGTVRRLEALGVRINAALFSAEGALYLAGEEGLWREDADGGLEQVGRGAFLDLTEWNGRIWAVSARGLSVLDERGLRTLGETQGLAAQSMSVLAACGSSLCIGAMDGLWRYDGRRFERLSAASGALPNDHVTAIAPAGAQTWVGTFEAGLARFGEQGGNELLSALDGLPDGRIQPRALAVMGNQVFAGGPEGLLWIRGGRVARVDGGLGQGEVFWVSASRRGGLWIGQRGEARRITVEAS